MPRKIPVGRDQEAEQLSQIRVISCAAFYDTEERSLRIVGEVRSASGVPIRDDKEIQAAVYDADGEIVERSTAYWSPFGLRQSFGIGVDDLPCEPARVEVYPVGMSSESEEDEGSDDDADDFPEDPDDD